MGASLKICHAFTQCKAIDVEIRHLTLLDVFALMCFEFQNDNITLQSHREDERYDSHDCSDINVIMQAEALLISY